MVRVLDIVSDYMRLRGLQHQRLDGSTPAQARHQVRCWHLIKRAVGQAPEHLDVHKHWIAQAAITTSWEVSWGMLRASSTNHLTSPPPPQQ